MAITSGSITTAFEYLFGIQFCQNADYDGKYNSVNSANNSYYFKYYFS